jgi:DNA methyltransferase 1-associated protein 1
MSSDVRDILELNQPSTTSNISKKVIYSYHLTNKSQAFKFLLNKTRKKIKRLIEPIKRPQGVHREVWGLICKDDLDQPPLIPAEEPKAIYQHPKAKLRYGVRKWHFIEFTNPARTDNAKFSHWRCVNDDPTKEYPFAKFNKQIKVIGYTEAEYNQYLNGDENWTKAETDHLLELCKRYDLRFFVIHDRWDPSIFPSAKKRTIDELKDR